MAASLATTSAPGVPAPDAPPAAGVSIDGVTVAYGTTTAVDGVDLDIPAGSSVALLGPSGCGKTSLLRAIAGLERPTHGRIQIGTSTVSSVDDRTWVKPERRKIGMVFQDGALFPHLTVAQNVRFGIRTSRGADERVAELLDLVDLGPLADRLPETLSGGQQQRVALARSLAPRPTVLLLDEPFSALDAQLRTQVRSDVVGILREVGVTAVFVTHDQDEAFVVGDLVAVMRDGRIEQVGTPDELYRAPTSPWVAAFVGEANLLSGRSANGAVGTVLGPVPVEQGASPTPGPVTVLVRPEQVALHEGSGAVVTSVEYYGHDVRYEVTFGTGEIVAVRHTTDQLRRVGDGVTATFAGASAPSWPERPDRA